MSSPTRHIIPQQVCHLPSSMLFFTRPLVTLRVCHFLITILSLANLIIYQVCQYLRILLLTYLIICASYYLHTLLFAHLIIFDFYHLCILSAIKHAITPDLLSLSGYLICQRVCHFLLGMFLLGMLFYDMDSKLDQIWGKNMKVIFNNA